MLTTAVSVAPDGDSGVAGWRIACGIPRIQFDSVVVLPAPSAAVATVPPATLAAGRLVIGASVLLVVVHARGLRLPSLGSAWRQYALLAVIGNAVPFYLIAWGQQGIDSALAGILIAIMPLATLVLAHYFVRGEHITRNRVIGFIF